MIPGIQFTTGCGKNNERRTSGLLFQWRLLRSNGEIKITENDEALEEENRKNNNNIYVITNCVVFICFWFPEYRRHISFIVRFRKRFGNCSARALKRKKKK